MPRFSVIGATSEEVEQAGGKNIKSTKMTQIVFSDMSEAQADALRERGFDVSEVLQVKITTIPPRPVEATPKHFPEQDMIEDMIKEKQLSPYCGVQA